MCRFLFWIMHCRIWDRCTVKSMREVYWSNIVPRDFWRSRWPFWMTSSPIDVIIGNQIILEVSIPNSWFITVLAEAKQRCWDPCRHSDDKVRATCKSQCFNTPYYNDVLTGAMASEITSLTTVYSTVYSGADQRKHQSSASLAFVGGIHHSPVYSPHKWPVTPKMFPFDDVTTIECYDSCLFKY